MIHGEWWVDRRMWYPRPYVPPRHTAAGDLFDEGFTGWRLETLGPLLPGPLHPVVADGDNDSASGPLTVWGTDRDGYFHSLLGAYHWQTQRQSPNVRGGVQIWPVSAIGRSRDDWVVPDDLVDQVDVYVRDLDAWASDPSELRSDRDPESETVSVPVKTRSANAVVGHAEVEVRWGRTVRRSIEHVSARPAALIRVLDTLPISEISDRWSRPLTRLMSLLMMRTGVIDRIEARLVERTAAGRSRYVELRFPQPLDGNQHDHADASIVKRQSEMLATRKTLAGVGAAWELLLPAFFDALDDGRFTTTLSLLTASQEKTEGFRFDDSLLYAFNGVESFHRTRFVGTVTEQPRIAEALQELKRGVPRELKETINPRLAPTRRKRMLEKINDILGICGGTATDLELACPDLASILNDARTASAHARTEQMTAQEQVDALGSTQWLLRHGLLQALGLDAHACDQIIQRHLHFKDHLRELAKRHRPQAPAAPTD